MRILTKYSSFLMKSLDLYVTLRIGPYVCAEWNYGGFPGKNCALLYFTFLLKRENPIEWLKEIPGIEFRTYNEPFMDQMALFMTQIVGILLAS